jgi:hypothetical protein
MKLKGSSVIVFLAYSTPSRTEIKDKNFHVRQLLKVDSNEKSGG